MRRGLQRWVPSNEIWDLQDEMSRFFSGFFGPQEASTSSVWAPLVDIHEDKEAVTITAELPGLKRDDVKINIEEGTLTIRGERKFENETKKKNYFRIERSYGSFYRSFSLPSTVQADKVKANMKDGVLEIYIPKKEEAKPKEIEIQVS